MSNVLTSPPPSVPVDNEGRTNRGDGERFLRDPNDLDEVEFEANSLHSPELSRAARMRGDNLMRAWRRTNFAFLCFHVPSMVSLLALLIVDWDHDCSERIFVWSEIQVCLLVESSVCT
jgi:hypothetical protein